MAYRRKNNLVVGDKLGKEGFLRLLELFVDHATPTQIESTLIAEGLFPAGTAPRGMVRQKLQQVRKRIAVLSAEDLAGDLEGNLKEPIPLEKTIEDLLPNLNIRGPQKRAGIVSIRVTVSNGLARVVPWSEPGDVLRNRNWQTNVWTRAALVRSRIRVAVLEVSNGTQAQSIADRVNERLRAARAVNALAFLFLLKEVEFRSNHSGANLFDYLVSDFSARPLGSSIVERNPRSRVNGRYHHSSRLFHPSIKAQTGMQISKTIGPFRGPDREAEGTGLGRLQGSSSLTRAPLEHPATAESFRLTPEHEEIVAIARKQQEMRKTDRPGEVRKTQIRRPDD